jgi:hypothetical protein
MKRIVLLGLAATLAMLMFVSPAAAQTNKNVQTVDLVSCTGGISSFTAETIYQSQATAVLVVSGSDARVFVSTKIVSPSGVVYYNVPGFNDKQTITCTDPFNGFIFTGFLAPAAG